MTTASILYDAARKYFLDGTVSPTTDTLKVALLSSAYNPRPSAAAWAPATVYALNTVIVSGGMFYEAIVAGVSSGALPAFPTIIDTTLVDNTTTWYCWGYAPPSQHAAFADVSANEIVGTGYTAGGVTLTSVTVALAAHTATLSAASAQWTGALFTAHYAVIYKSGTANSIVNPLIGYVLLDITGVDVPAPVTALFSLVWSSAGIFTLS